MAVNVGRQQILSVFKQLQRTREKVFIGDDQALTYVRQKIKEEFVKHKHVNNPKELKELYTVAQESEELMRSKVIQAEQIRPNIFRIRTEHLQEKCVNARERCANCTCGW